MFNINPEMGKVKYPFNTYDYFGYLIPGATFFIITYFFDLMLFKNFSTSKVFPLTNFHIPVYNFFNILINNTVSINTWAIWLIFLFSLIILAYVVGHIIASFSSLVIDKMIVRKGFKYPYSLLLKIEPVKRHNPFSNFFYRGLFFWIICFFVISYYLHVEIRHMFHLEYLIVCYIIINIFIKVILTSNEDTKHFLNKHLSFLVTRMRKRQKSNNSRFFYNYFYIFAVPFDVLYSIFAHFFNIKDPFPDDFIIKYKQNFFKTFHIDPENADTNNFWLSYCYVINKCQYFSDLINNWLYLYSYSRNLSACFFLGFLYCYLSLFQPSAKIAQIGFVTLYFPIILIIISILLFLRYQYLYISYFSKFVFRTFVYLVEIETNIKE